MIRLGLFSVPAPKDAAPAKPAGDGQDEKDASKDAADDEKRSNRSTWHNQPRQTTIEKRS